MVIDTFPGFLAFWHKAQKKPPDAQIEGWAAEYMSQWPELLEKQLDDYASQNMDWHQVAKERVFPFLNDRLAAMKSAHKNLLELCGSVYCMAQEKFGFESDLVFVIYVGVGCGAGWATTFEDKPAILFGLENIAECGWSDGSSLAGLIAHEIGHLVHKIWRREGGLIEGSGPWWQLFSEGFAQICEHEILGKESWHVSMGMSRSEWLQWCRERASWLAGEFLRRADTGESVRPFFGSWLDVQGKKHTGHFLGHELVKELRENMTLKQIALLDNIESIFRSILEKIAP